MALHRSRPTPWSRFPIATEAACSVGAASTVRYGVDGRHGPMGGSKSRQGAFPGGNAGSCPRITAAFAGRCSFAGNQATFFSNAVAIYHSIAAAARGGTLAFCRKPMPSDAAKCSSCGNWRRDIHELIDDFRRLAIAQINALIIGAILASVSFGAAVWARQRGLSSAITSHPRSSSSPRGSPLGS